MPASWQPRERSALINELSKLGFTMEFVKHDTRVGYERWHVTKQLDLLMWGRDGTWALRERLEGAVGYVEHDYRVKGRGGSTKTAAAVELGIKNYQPRPVRTQGERHV